MNLWKKKVAFIAIEILFFGLKQFDTASFVYLRSNALRRILNFELESDCRKKVHQARETFEVYL